MRHRVIGLVVLLAFALQGYVTQTHIHIPARADVSISLAKDAASSQNREQGKYPPGGDPANCPLCQEILHAGAYVAPSAAALSLPSIAIFAIAIVVEVSHYAEAYSHNWQGRAPPRV